MSAITDRLNDFPDRLSPMLVKELRQGLRARTFVVVFLVLQGLLGLILLAASAGTTSARGGEMVSEIVFVLFALSVLVIQPLRGVAALSSEIKGQTIDLMVLTRLSALRIVLGKWVAIVSQSGLLTATIIPYLILRYYFGGMNLFAELMLVALIFLLSAGLTAITVGISACKSILLRGLLPILGTPVLVWCIFGITFGRGLPTILEVLSMSDTEKNFGILLFVTTTAYLAWSALSLGASLIAPHAENHATLRRVIALVATTGALFIIKATDAPWGMASMLWFLYAAPAIGMALAEPEQLIATVCRPFVRKGVFGMFAGRLLYPGWPSGVFFSLIICVIGIFGLAYTDTSHSSTDILIMTLGYVGSLLLPGTILVLAASKIKDRAATFILLWFAFAVLASVIKGMDNAISSDGFLWIFVWDPLILPMMPNSYRSTYPEESVLTVGAVVVTIYAVVLFIAALSASRRIRDVEKQALEA